MYKSNSVKGKVKLAKKREPIQGSYKDFIPNAKKSFPISRKSKDVKPELLNTKQRFAYEIVKTHFESQSDKQLLMLISGVAGTGKSFFINSIRPLLLKYKQPFKVVSYTGASAWLAGGATFHSTLHMPYAYRGAPPSHGVSQAQKSLRTTRFLIVDEMR